MVQQMEGNTWDMVRPGTTQKVNGSFKSTPLSPLPDIPFVRFLSKFRETGSEEERDSWSQELVLSPPPAWLSDRSPSVSKDNKPRSTAPIYVRSRRQLALTLTLVSWNPECQQVKKMNSFNFPGLRWSGNGLQTCLMEWKEGQKSIMCLIYGQLFLIYSISQTSMLCGQHCSPFTKCPRRMTLFVQSEQLAESKDFKSPMTFQRPIILGCNSGKLISRKTNSTYRQLHCWI